ncbi:MAG TPA: hypothetical protein ENN60_03545 [archaeon]|nr:hypothetical protein [archaeon]
MPHGKHSRVLLAGPLAFKLLNPGFRANARKEARFLRQLRSTGMAPRFYFRLGRLLVMERIQGTPVRNMTPDQVRQTAPLFLKVLHQLDGLGIQKEEAHRPDKHFIHTPQGVRLLDFERARKNERPSNVTQFVNFLDRYFPGIRKLGHAYKSSYDLKPLLEFIRAKK